MKQNRHRVGSGHDSEQGCEQGSGEADRWNQRYARRTHEHGARASVFLRSIVEELGSGRALDLASGTGRNAVFLAQRGFKVTGVDVSSVGVERAQRLANQQGVEIQTVEADLCHWNLGQDAWDLILQFYYLERSLFAKIAAALKPGGFFVLEHFSSDHPSVADFGPSRPEFLLFPNELPRLVRENGLRLRFYQDRVVELDEGGHRGKAAVVRAIAEKV